MISVESPRAVYQPTQPQRGSLRPRPQSAPTARIAPDPQAASKWRSNGSPVTAGDRRKEEYVHEQARLRADSLREAHRQRQLRRSYAPPSFASGPLHSARTAQQPQTPVHNLLEDLGAEGAAARQRVTRLLAENARLRAEAARLSERAQRAELLQAEVMQLQARLRAEERARQAAEAVAREVMAAEARLRGGVAADGEVAALEEEISAAQAAAERTARARRLEEEELQATLEARDFVRDAPWGGASVLAAAERGPDVDESAEVRAARRAEAEREAVAAAEQLLLSTGRSKMALND